MILSSFFKSLLPIASVSLALACSGGGDGGGGGDGDGDGDGDGSGGVMGDGDTGGTASGGSGTGGEMGDGDGDGPIEYGSGTVDLTFNETSVQLEVWTARDRGELGFNIVADSTDGGTIDGIQLTIHDVGVGMYDCTVRANASIIVQAEDAEGTSSAFESGGVDSCSITITEYGEVGGTVRGTFAAELEAVGGMIGTTAGTFNVVRGSN